MRDSRRLVRWVRFLALLTAAPGSAGAFTVSILNGPPTTVYLQVGVGGFSGTYLLLGTPGNNTTVNTASVTVPPAQVGNGSAQAMSTDSTVGASSFDGRAFCTVGTQLYIGGFYRTAGLGGTRPATVTATVPAALIDSSGDTLSFSQISWTSSGNGDTGGEPFPGGSFVAGGVQTVGTIAQNQWAESCWTFSYANTTVPAAGTYTGVVLFTLVSP